MTTSLSRTLAALLALATPAAAQTTVTAGGHAWAVAYADWFAIEGAWAVEVGLAMREDFSYDAVAPAALATPARLAAPCAQELQFPRACRAPSTTWCWREDGAAMAADAFTPTRLRRDSEGSEGLGD
jgi:hypothetical protein